MRKIAPMDGCTRVATPVAPGRAWRLLLAVAAVLVVCMPGVAWAEVGQFPEPEASSYVLVDGSTGRVLAAKDPDRPLPMASTTKIMTALVVLDRADFSDRYTVPPEAVIGGSSSDLVAGESVSVADLFTGLMVASGNDSAITLAIGLAGSQEAFVALMNRRARELGLEQTGFRNPHGLDQPGHASSVRDLVALSRVAMRDPRFRQAAGSPRAQIPGPGGMGTRWLESKNLLLDNYDEADGVKTGMTDDAGYALVAHARRPALGVNLYAALIGSPSEEARARDGEAMLRWGFQQYARPQMLAPGAVVGSAQVKYRPGVEVQMRVDRGIRAPIRLDAPVTQRLVAPHEVAAPVAEGEVLGVLEVRQDGRVVARRDVVAAESVEGPTPWDRMRAAWGALIP